MSVGQSGVAIDMNPENLLPNIAELALALLGFSGIVSIFQARGTGWRPDGRFWAMLRCGLASLTFSLLPLPLLGAGLEAAVVWGLTSPAFALFGAVYVGHSVVVARRTDTTGVFSLPLFSTFMAASSVASLLLLYNTFGPREFWPYLTALCWFIIHPALLLVRLLRLWLTDSQ